MKKYYARLWVKKYIRYNADKFSPQGFSRELNRAVTTLSHRVYRTHGAKGHVGRQEIRNELWKYAVTELQKYYQRKTSKPRSASPRRGVT